MEGTESKLSAWTRTVKEDLEILWSDILEGHDSLCKSVEKLGHPSDNANPWIELIKTKEKWREVVKIHCTYDFSHMVSKAPLYDIPVGMREEDVARCPEPGCKRPWVS